MSEQSAIIVAGQNAAQKRESADPYPTRSKVTIGWVDSRQLTALHQSIRWILNELSGPDPSIPAIKNNLLKQQSIINDIDRQSESARAEMEMADARNDGCLCRLEEFVNNLPSHLDAELRVRRPAALSRDGEKK